MPDLGRQAPAVHLDAVHVHHRHLGVRVAHPHRGGEVRGEAVEPRVGEVVGRAGLGGRRAADRRAGRRARLHVLAQNPRRLVGHGVGEHLLALRPTQVLRLAVGEHDLLDGDRLVAVAAGGDRRVGIGHLQRRHAQGQAAQPLGGVAVEVRRDAHVVCGLAHRVGAHVEVELGEHGVVGLECGLDQVHVAAVAVGVGADLPRPPRRVEVQRV